ncbi:MAG: aminopeptidase N, partial [Pseudomonadota bacterium]
MALKGDQPQTPVLRKHYQPPTWLVDSIDMTIVLDAEQTHVRSELRVRRNPQPSASNTALTLHGVGLDTQSVRVNGRRLSEGDYGIHGEMLTIDDVPAAARIVTEVQIDPSQNTALEGLYQSGNSLLTQCEAEGFRKITWFIDRPDIMSRFRVRLEADAGRYPLLLGNGNLIDSGTLNNDRHFAVWDDPFPKPSYLFALVAGDLGLLEDTFTTMSGRQVALKVYSEHDNIDQLDHAMQSLKKSMAWDEQRYGLEYDLDVYHIVATHDFNMGAMENKSLNIFNARYVLADPDTATDFDYAGVEGVIAHEYFHNWTGNRVTCRDWFQLTLKEGLTVFRDQEFSADMQSAAVTRIQNIDGLMNRQFAEDAGPMAHPIRPQRYVEINNFYTATVYEKGAEVIRMYQTLLGRDGFRRGMDLYFERHDGQAVTCDDFLAAMADANDVDLSQFSRWYDQVGTPTLCASAKWLDAEGRLELSFEQSLIEHADNADLGPLLIPLRLGFIDAEGRSLASTLNGETRKEHLLILTDARQTASFSGFEQRPVVSLLRGYSAPVTLEFDWSELELALLLAHDADPVARWLAGKRLAAGVLGRAIEALEQGRSIDVP